MSCFLIGLDGGISALFLLVEGFLFPSDLDVEVFPLVEDEFSLCPKA